MNKFYNYLSIAACAILAASATSCSDKEQTCLDLNSMPQKASVTGVLSYSEGVTLIDGKFHESIKPVAGQTVDIIVDNDDYKSGAKGETLIASVVTDENGRYSAEIPMPLTSSVNVIVRPHDFEGIHYSVEKENNKPVNKQSNVIYHAYQSSKNITGGSKGVLNIEYSDFSSLEQIEMFKGTAKLNIKVGKLIDRYTPAVTARYEDQTSEDYNKLFLASSPKRITCFDIMASADALITVTYSNNEVRTYNATSGSNGVMTLTIPVIDTPSQFTCEVEFLPVIADYRLYEQYSKEWSTQELDKWVSGYPYYYSNYNVPYNYDYKATTVKGYYSASRKTFPANLQVSTPLNFEAKVYYFTAYDGTYIGVNGTEWLEDIVKEESNQ